MRRPGRATILALSLVVLLGAGSAVLRHMTADSRPTVDYYPLAEGYWWEYGVDGAAFDSLLARVELLPDSDGEEGPYAVEVLIPESHEIWHRALYRNDSDGVKIKDLTWEEGGQHYVQIQAGYVLLSPLEEGNRWSWETGFSDREGNAHDLILRADFSVEGIESVEVPAGIFENCLKVVRENRFRRQGEWYRVQQVLWYAPGVGLVLEEHYADDHLLGRCFLTAWSVPR